MKTRLVKVQKVVNYGAFISHIDSDNFIDVWEVSSQDQAALEPLMEAAKLIRETDIPVAFPTETVYGLGADATRGEAVQGIYKAKNRPSDNPLISHICDLKMLRELLVPATTNEDGSVSTSPTQAEDDPIPAIYKPLISKFWPGPLTIILRNPSPSRLAPQVTGGLETFGARMPESQLALSLIKLAGVPIAAPSANASTRPSPTTAQHVLEDMNGRIELILDGGPCRVGVESTVVDGLCDPPVVLRPGGVSVEQIRQVPGWEKVAKAYRDQSEAGKPGGGPAPRAPGMKYKHYSPRAKVILYENSSGLTSKEVYAEIVKRAAAAAEAPEKAKAKVKKHPTVGVVRTYAPWNGPYISLDRWKPVTHHRDTVGGSLKRADREEIDFQMFRADMEGTTVYDVDIGPSPIRVAQSLFAALRELDARGADVIYVEGISDADNIAAAVMNRVRKAASETRE